MPNPSEYEWENVMYEYHFYGWDGMNDVKVQKSFTDSKVVKNNQAGHEVPVLVGEFTLFEKEQSWEHALRIYEKNGWSWTTWTYKTVNMGSWGIYNSTLASTPKVDIYQDSEEVIRDKWSKASTSESFTVNQSLYPVLQKWAGRTSQDAAAELALEQAAIEAQIELDQQERSEAERLIAEQREKEKNDKQRSIIITGCLLLLAGLGLATLLLLKRKGRRS
jgi:hypothetical protein